MLSHAQTGGIEFPFDAVKVEFLLQAFDPKRHGGEAMALRPVGREVL